MDNQRKVFLLPKEFVNPGNQTCEELKIITLKCPHTDNAVKYLLDPVKYQLLEILQFSEEKSSWFIGDSVEKDGSLYISTPIDPLFLALPYLRKSKMFSPLDQLFVDSEFSNSKCLVQCCSKTIDLITDNKDIGSTIVYRYNEQKTINWLKTKVERVINMLSAKEIDCSSGAKSATLVQKKRGPEDSNRLHLYAYGIICEYLDEELGQELCKALRIEDLLRKGSSEDSPKKSLKKLKTSDVVEPTEDFFEKFSYDNKKAKKPTKLSANQKKLMKVDKTGMKNISNFFGKSSNK